MSASMTRAGGSGPAGRHHAMVSGPGGSDWDDRVHRAWCRDCDWSVDDLTYYRAANAAAMHEAQS